MRFFIDIDNTLTTGRAMWSEPNLEMIAKVEKLIEQGHEVIIWSTGGTGYAREKREACNVILRGIRALEDLWVEE